MFRKLLKSHHSGIETAWETAFELKVAGIKIAPFGN